MFEIPFTAGSYASEQVTLVTFSGGNGRIPLNLTADADGNLLGTTVAGGPHNDGTVFEVRYINGSDDSMPTTLARFNGTNGDAPYSGVTIDAAGNLFGTTNGGGANHKGTVFEIAKASTDHANPPTTLVSFNGIDGYQPLARPAIDAAGDLFGTTVYGGAANNGTVFEIP